MDSDPGPGRLGELVVHVVGLVQEQLQHQTVVGPGEGHLSHRHRRAQPGVEGVAVAVLGMREGVPVPFVRAVPPFEDAAHQETGPVLVLDHAELASQAVTKLQSVGFIQRHHHFYESSIRLEVSVCFPCS